MKDQEPIQETNLPQIMISMDGDSNDDIPAQPPSYAELMGNGKPSCSDQVNETICEDETKLNGFKSKRKKGSESEVKVRRVGFFHLFRFADRVDVLFMVVGTVAAIACGLAFPSNILVYGEMIDAFIQDRMMYYRPEGPIQRPPPPAPAFRPPPGRPPFLNGIPPTGIPPERPRQRRELSEKFDWNGDNIYRERRAASPNLGTTNSFIQNSTVSQKPVRNLYGKITSFTIYFCIIACSVFVMGYFSLAFWSWTGERQVQRIRKAFFESVLKQEIAWFDTNQTGELNTRMADDVSKLHDGFGEKMATFLQYTTTFLAGFILAFVKGWKLSLVILSVIPIIAIATTVAGKLVRKITSSQLKAYAKAGAIAEEVFSSIRTVIAYGGEEREVNRYCANLDNAKRKGIRKGAISGAMLGCIWLCVIAAMALAFWFGSRLVREGEITPGAILQVLISVIIGSMSLGQAAPNLESFANARAAAATLFDIIDQKPAIDSSSEEGEKPEVAGNIDFEDVHFNYPSRPDVPVLQGLTFNVKVGQTVALIGQSGCGKSTSVQLLQRFYDVSRGKICVDGHNIKDLNVSWLRQNIGVVSQEPVLFATTIEENIRHGKEGVSTEEIIEASCRANAHDFIMALPEGYNTLVGERGSQLSGGQKQRIAIARALVRNPKILLLDEATSALDNESEALVQDALNKASEGRTTIVIAHRLSTIKNADIIYGIEDGHVIESGTHNFLMLQQGLYYDLVNYQTHADGEKAEEEEEELLEELADELGVDLSNVDSKDELTARRHAFRSSLRSSRSMQSVRSQHKVENQQYTPEEDPKKVEEDEVPPAPIRRIMSLNSPEWVYITFGCCAAIFTGAMNPTFAVVMSEILGVFAYRDKGRQEQEINLYCGIFALVSVVVGVAFFLQGYLFAVSSERLTKRLRQMTFAILLKQEIGWFDKPCNQVGALTARLSSDAAQVHGATGSRMGLFIQSIANMGSAVVIAFIFGWKLTLIVLLFLPVIISMGAFQSKLIQGYSKSDKKAIEEGGKLSTEAIENIRTVVSLNREKYFINKYHTWFRDLYKQDVKKSHVYGITYGLTQCVIFFAYAAVFTYGAKLVEDGEMHFKDVIKIFSAITFGGMSLGRASSFAPDYAKAKLSAAKLISLFDRKPAITENRDGKILEKCSGDIRIQDVKFIYPTRPEVAVLQDLDLHVESGKTLALVGASGCGKSTIMQLIQRFYEPQEGNISVDNQDIKSLRLSWLRSQIGIVSQEPVLFDASIADNIAYGDNKRDVSMQEIIAAAQSANIHNFITTLPMGYDTVCGDKGTQLSGGQKQRVAIARALLRNPKILLLDEATSALDSESERMVQEALDRAAEGRTCIIIAHRLSTVQHADMIAVVHHGQVLEQGTQAELLNQEGLYHKLYTAANKKKLPRPASQPKQLS